MGGNALVGGTPPLQFWRPGSGKKGRRLAGELPAVPDSSTLSSVGQRAQRVLLDLVGGDNGRLHPSGAIPVGHLDVLTDLMAEWVRHYGTRSGDTVRFNTRGCGGWYVFDRLVPLQNPNRSDGLRAAVYEHLRTDHGWTGIGTGPRFNSYDIRSDFVARRAT